ncbi:MAG: fimbrillin family protein [Bacteroidales bacterium]|nr:fimbrillin family protein [Bacteroidales bacterium]
MKRYIFIVAAIVLATVSCSRTYDLNGGNEGQAIGFGTWAETLTKARATGSDNTAFENGEAFDVYGFKTVASGDKVVFNGDDVTATVSGSTVTWDYSPHRFWDPAASSYTFFAALPAGQLAAEGANPYATTGLFTSSDITFDDPTAFDNDILVGKQVVPGTGSDVPYTYSGPVDIQFNHIASCVDLKVKQDNTLGNAEVKVTALSLVGISNVGSYTVSAYGASSPYTPTVAWTPASGTLAEYVVLDSADASDDVTVAGKTTYDAHAATGTTDTPADLFTGYVFMPQDLVADTQKVKLSYTVQVGTEEPNVYTDIEIDLRDFQQTDTDNNSGTAITAWAPKTHYTYYITIGANLITFTATVNEWATAVNGYYYLLN